jgi:ketosteroid isomerase-like protein
MKIESAALGGSMVTSSTNDTKATLSRHLEAAVSKNLDAILEDYGDESVIYTPDGPIRGLDEIRAFFTEFLANVVTPEFLSNLKMLRQDVEGEIAYIVWTAGDIVPFATDTMVVRNGKVLIQTFASYKPGSS